MEVTWTGNTGAGTSSYGGYSRAHDISAAGKRIIEGSSDAAFRGDATKYNPEELFVSALSACHLLWFLHLAADAGLVVDRYRDRARGEMIERPDGSGEFVRVDLHPTVQTRTPTDPDLIERLHTRAGAMCFIARSVNFPVTVSAPTRP